MDAGAAAGWKKGDRIKVVKAGAQMGMEGTITKPEWKGVKIKVKVVMDGTGDIKSYMPKELLNLMDTGLQAQRPSAQASRRFWHRAFDAELSRSRRLKREAQDRLQAAQKHLPLVQARDQSEMRAKSQLRYLQKPARFRQSDHTQEAEQKGNHQSGEKARRASWVGEFSKQVEQTAAKVTQSERFQHVNAFYRDGSENVVQSTSKWDVNAEGNEVAFVEAADAFLNERVQNISDFVEGSEEWEAHNKLGKGEKDKKVGDLSMASAENMTKRRMVRRKSLAKGHFFEVMKTSSDCHHY
jgi:hypothetical protein